MATRNVEDVKVYVDDKGLIHVDNAIITSKNFSGVEKRNPHNPKQVVNSKGNRNFSIILNEEAADLLSNYRIKGEDDKKFKIQVKLPTADAEDQTPKIYMSIKVSYHYDQDGKPMWFNPTINQYSSKGKTEKTEKNVDSIDDVYIDKADLVFSARPYDVNGKVGLAADLRKLNYLIKEDDLDAKWDQTYLTDDPTDMVEEMPFD